MAASRYRPAALATPIGAHEESVLHWEGGFN
jgi:hypothetical protein